MTASENHEDENLPRGIRSTVAGKGCPLAQVVGRVGEGFGDLEVGGLVSAGIGVAVGDELADAQTGFAVDRVEPDPDQTGAEDVFEEIDLRAYQNTS